MRGIIDNEVKEVERIIDTDSNEWGIGMGKVILLLGKYYFSQGLDREEVYSSITSFLKDKLDKYTPKKWSEIVNNVLDTIEKNEWFNLVVVDKIEITKAEWETIVNINNKQLEKLAFVTLCYVKLYKARGSVKDRIEELTSIMKEAGIATKKENKLLFADLKDLELVEIGTLRHMYVKPLYINEESETFITIDNFEKVVTYWDEYKNGNRYKTCEVCGKRFKISKKDCRSKYCSKCKKEIANKQKLLSKHKNIKNGERPKIS